MAKTPIAVLAYDSAPYRNRPVLGGSASWTDLVKRGISGNLIHRVEPTRFRGWIDGSPDDALAALSRDLAGQPAPVEVQGGQVAEVPKLRRDLARQIVRVEIQALQVFETAKLRWNGSRQSVAAEQETLQAPQGPEFRRDRACRDPGLPENSSCFLATVRRPTSSQRQVASGVGGFF